MQYGTWAKAALTLAIVLVAVPVDAKDPITVTMDRAKVMRLPSPADTVIIGNPGIADATIHDRMTLVLTGKLVGITNLVVLDAKGNPIADEVISVGKVQEGMVTVQRGSERFSYNCTPHCNGMFEVGDSQTSFGNVQQQIQKRNALGMDTQAPPQ